MLNRYFTSNNELLSNLQIGDEIRNIDRGDVCEKYPLYKGMSDFPHYKGEKRDNSIETGIILDINTWDEVKTALIKADNKVLCLRLQ